MTNNGRRLTVTLKIGHQVWVVVPPGWATSDGIDRSRPWAGTVAEVVKDGGDTVVAVVVAYASGLSERIKVEAKDRGRLVHTNKTAAEAQLKQWQEEAEDRG